MKNVMNIRNPRHRTAELLMAVALTALAMGKAWGAELKTDSVIAGDTVTVGDVFRDSGESSSRYLAPAPAPGSALTLKVPDLTRISDAFGLGWTPDTPNDHAVIRRAAADIVDRYAIEAALQEKISAMMSGQKFDTDISDHNLSLRVPTDGAKTVQVDDMKIDLAKNHFTALISAGAGTRKEVQGRVYALAQVPVLKNPMRPGDVIGAEDVDYLDMRATDISSSTVVEAAKIIGMTPRRGISAMKPVAIADLEQPMMVKKGDLVTVMLKSGILNLTVQGRALQNGSEGEAVRVVNTASNRTLEGIVTGSQTVAVQSPSAALLND